MKLFGKSKEEREARESLIKKVDEKIDKDIEEMSAEDLSMLVDTRHKVKYNGVDPGDILKVVANIAVVAVLVGFEMSHVLSQKGSRFIKTL